MWRDEVQNWNEANPVESDRDTIDVSEESDDHEDVEEIEVSASEALKAFNTAIRWSESNILDLEDIPVLQKCRDKALQKSLTAKQKQQAITKYFGRT